ITLVIERENFSFWRLNIAGWLAYGVAMSLSRVGRFPFVYMICTKTALAAVCLLITGFVLRPPYRRVLFCPSSPLDARAAPAGPAAHARHHRHHGRVVRRSRRMDRGGRNLGSSYRPRVVESECSNHECLAALWRHAVQRVHPRRLERVLRRREASAGAARPTR